MHNVVTGNALELGEDRNPRSDTISQFVDDAYGGDAFPSKHLIFLFFQTVQRVAKKDRCHKILSFGENMGQT